MRLLILLLATACHGEAHYFIRGDVKDKAGAPLDAIVGSLRSCDGTEAMAPAVITDRSGEFTYEFIGPGGLRAVRAATDGYRAQCVAAEKNDTCVSNDGERVRCTTVHFVLEKR